jgi:hypothetical protein
MNSSALACAARFSLWRCCCDCQVGDAKFTKQHDAIQKLNMQVCNQYERYLSILLLVSSLNAAGVTLSTVASAHGTHGEQKASAAQHRT